MVHRKSLVEKIKKIPVFYILCGIVIIALAIQFISSFPSENQQYTDLADSFLHGKLYFRDDALRADAVYHDGHYYWALGVFPAILLLPFVAISKLFGLFFFQEFLYVPLLALSLYLIYKLAKKFGASKKASHWWTFAFLAGTSLLGIATSAMSWFFASLVGLVLLLLALNEFFGRKRWWLLGVLTAVLFLTRPTAAVALGIFLALHIFFEKKKSKDYKIFSIKNWKKLLRIALPVLVSVGIFGAYNFARFGSVFETGYADQIYANHQNDLTKFDERARKQGTFSPVHMPGQLYNIFLSAPTPVYQNNLPPILEFPYLKSNTTGMSLLLISPWLLWLFTVKKKRWTRTAVFLVASGIFCLLLNACFFGLGYSFFGLRYSLDFLPFFMCAIFMLYFKEHKELTVGMKTLITVSALFNLYLLFSLLIGQA